MFPVADDIVSMWKTYNEEGLFLCMGLEVRVEGLMVVVGFFAGGVQRQYRITPGRRQKALSCVPGSCSLL